MAITNLNTALRDIAAAIESVERSTAGMDRDDFREAPAAIAAVERQLHVISEAAVRLGRDAETLCPGPSWRDLRGIANWLPKRHEWNWLSTVWKLVQTDLPLLKTVVLRALDTPNDVTT